MTTHIDLLKMMAGFCDKGGDERAAEKYRKKAEKLKQDADRRYSQR